MIRSKHVNQVVNSFSTETRVWDNDVNIMAADALAPYVAKSSAAMALTMQDEWVLVFQGERFQPVIVERWQKIKYIFMYVELTSAW